MMMHTRERHNLYRGMLGNSREVFVEETSSSSSSLYSWRSTDGALSAGASIISCRGGDSIIKSASGV